MNTVIICVGLAVTAASVVFLVRDVRRKRERERRMAEVLSLANDALAAGRGPRVIASGTIPADSELGRYLEKIFAQIPCGCPNWEESRRIAHAAEKRGES